MKVYAVPVFSRLRAALFLLPLLIGGCVVVPTVNPSTDVVTCCSAYTYLFGYTWSGTYQKQGNNWSANGKVSWKYLHGP
jgi:hypothetical protein